MSGPRPAGALIYASNMPQVAAFYRDVLGMMTLTADADHQVIENADIQLIIHAIPPHIAATFTISTPPDPREEASIKLFFTVQSLAASSAVVERCGGGMVGPQYEHAGMFIRNGYDVEGNIFHLRAYEA